MPCLWEAIQNMINYKWTKGFFSSTSELYSSEKKIGELKKEAFSTTVYGNINESHYKFMKKGLFDSGMEIIDLKSKNIIGRITFNSWNTKSQILLDNQKFEWKSDSFWNNKWSIQEHNKKLIEFKKSGLSDGYIKSTTTNDLLLITGILSINYYQKIAAFIIIMTSIIINS
ncbi:hypothetical protein DCS32_11000 [Dokdonia sp. Dokd-P16]|nr:hypothetical protein DCS32_11000 [Dokdonia sp. Dokd-P16]